MSLTFLHNTYVILHYVLGTMYLNRGHKFPSIRLAECDMSLWRPFVVLLPRCLQFVELLLII